MGRPRKNKSKKKNNSKPTLPPTVPPNVEQESTSTSAMALRVDQETPATSSSVPATAPPTPSSSPAQQAYHSLRNEAVAGCIRDLSDRAKISIQLLSLVSQIMSSSPCSSNAAEASPSDMRVQNDRLAQMLVDLNSDIVMLSTYTERVEEELASIQPRETRDRLMNALQTLITTYMEMDANAEEVFLQRLRSLGL